MLNIDWVKEKISSNNYVITKHGNFERQNDNILLVELEETIVNGRILESYADTGRGESCLVAGFSKNGKPIHCVVGERYDKLVIITVYVPTPPKFKNIFERGE